jgi:flagellar hook-basal body complex protein FliE
MRVVANPAFVPELADGVTAAKQASSPADSFGDELARFVGEVHEAQATADGEAQRLAQGQGNVHETALALEKADIEMRLLMKGRNKIIEAYQEISRMPV